MVNGSSLSAPFFLLFLQPLRQPFFLQERNRAPFQMIVVFPMLETGSAHLIEDGVIGKKGKLTAAAFNFDFLFFDQSAVVIEHSISPNPSRRQLSGLFMSLQYLCGPRYKISKTEKRENIPYPF